MRKQSMLWETTAFLFTLAAGVLLHFLYGWSGGSSVAAAFSPVNESTWEHMKLVFFPLFAFSVAQVCFLGGGCPNFLAVRAVSTLAGTAAVPVLFYTYTGIVGRPALWADIAVFAASVLLALVVDRRLLRRGSLSSGWQQAAGLLALWAAAFWFVYCTFRPPTLPLFFDPVTGLAGMPPIQK